MAFVAQTCTSNEPSGVLEGEELKEAMRGCDVPGINCWPRNEKFNDCMFLYELGRWSGDFGFACYGVCTLC